MASATPEFIPRTKVEVIDNDDMVEEITQKVLERFRGDPNLGGKIFISHVAGGNRFRDQRRRRESDLIRYNTIRILFIVHLTTK